MIGSSHRARPGRLIATCVFLLSVVYLVVCGLILFQSISPHRPWFAQADSRGSAVALSPTIPPFPPSSREAAVTQPPPVAVSRRPPSTAVLKASHASTLPGSQLLDREDFRGITWKHAEYRAHQHPGGTEAEALAERRRLEETNWAGGEFQARAWRARERPVVPPELQSSQEAQSSDRIDRSLLRASLVECGEDPARPAAATRLSCLVGAYERRMGRADDLACSDIYGTRLLQRLRAGLHVMCEGRGRVDCMSARVSSEHEIDTSVCGAMNMVLDVSRIGDGDFPWLAFTRGAWRSQCERVGASAGHWHFIHCLKDWMDLGFEEVPPNAPSPGCDVEVAHPVLFVTRSGDYSPFALVHDWANALILLAATNTSRLDLEIVIMDRMTTGFFTPMWQMAFAPSHRLRWFPDIRDQWRSKRVCFRQAYFNIPARLSPLYNSDSCGPSPILRLLSDLLLAQVGADALGPTHRRVVLTVIVRMNYATGHVIERRIPNSDQLVDALRDVAAITLPDGRRLPLLVNALDYSDLDFDQQLRVSRSTDVLIGMHGAGLIQAMFQPVHGGVFEFFCPDRPPSNTRYENLARRLGLQYGSLDIEDPTNKVPVPSAVTAIISLASSVAGRKFSDEFM